MLTIYSFNKPKIVHIGYCSKRKILSLEASGTFAFLAKELKTTTHSFLRADFRFSSSISSWMPLSLESSRRFSVFSRIARLWGCCWAWDSTDTSGISSSFYKYTEMKWNDILHVNISFSKALSPLQTSKFSIRQVFMWQFYFARLYIRLILPIFFYDKCMHLLKS